MSFVIGPLNVLWRVWSYSKLLLGFNPVLIQWVSYQFLSRTVTFQFDLSTIWRFLYFIHVLPFHSLPCWSECSGFLKLLPPSLLFQMSLYRHSWSGCCLKYWSSRSFFEAQCYLSMHGCREDVAGVFLCCIEAKWNLLQSSGNSSKKKYASDLRVYVYTWQMLKLWAEDSPMKGMKLRLTVMKVCHGFSSLI